MVKEWSGMFLQCTVRPFVVFGIQVINLIYLEFGSHLTELKATVDLKELVLNVYARSTAQSHIRANTFTVTFAD